MRLTVLGVNRFSRVTSSGHYIPQIDGLRCISILLVLAHHVFAAYLELTHRLGTQQLPRDWAMISSQSPLVAWALHLAFGVPLFCTISGFVLTVPFALAYLKGSPPPSFKSYLLRRLIRLEPPYVLNLALLFLVIVMPWWGGPDAFAHFSSYFRAFAPHLLASLFYLHGAVYGQASWINGVAWTLEIEIQFYLLLPFLAKLFRWRRDTSRRIIFLVLIIGAGLIAQFAVPRAASARLSLSLPVLLHFFIAGVLLADLYVDPPQALQFGPRMGDVLAVLSGALIVYVLHWNPQFAWIEPLLVIAFCWAIFRGAFASHLFQLPVLTIIGGMSYTIYLYHFAIIRWLLPLTVRIFPPAYALWWDAAAQFAMMLPPVLGLSAVLFLLTEKPFMVLSHRLSRRSQPDSVAASAAKAARV